MQNGTKKSINSFLYLITYFFKYILWLFLLLEYTLNRGRLAVLLWIIYIMYIYIITT